MSLSTCEKCGGNIPLGPDATNRCETCGAFVFPGIHPAKRPMEGGFSLDKFLSGITKEDAEALGEMFDKMEEQKKLKGWIPCNERLPDRNHRVLILSPIFGVEVGTMSCEGWFDLHGYFEDSAAEWCEKASTVTHWMPLPEPPAV